MGYKWEVLAWERNPNTGKYGDRQVYFGKYLIGAIIAAIRAKSGKNPSGCVRIMWRS